MCDILCRKCGEPWDVHGIINDVMSKKESRKFLEGEGCPSCSFGQKQHFKSALNKEILSESFYSSLAKNFYEILGE